MKEKERNREGERERVGERKRERNQEIKRKIEREGERWRSERMDVGGDGGREWRRGRLCYCLSKQNSSFCVKVCG